MAERVLKPGVMIEVDPNELKFHKSNRPPSEKHIDKLKNALSVNNLLHVEPIKINTRYEIIDGQHRTKAAIELGFKVVPCLVVAATVHDAQELNQHQKNWSIKDFAHYWAEQGKNEYKEYIEFLSLTGLPPSVAIDIVGTGRSGGHSSNSFRKGNFKVKNMPYAYRFMDKLEDFKEIIKDYRSSSFLRAIWRCYNHGKYDHARMVHKCKLVGIRTAASSERYLEILEEAYNWKVKVEERVRFKE